MSVLLILNHTSQQSHNVHTQRLQSATVCVTKEFEVEVEVQYSITVNARNEEEAKNAIYEIDFDSVSYGEEISYLSSSVDRVDI